MATDSAMFASSRRMQSPSLEAFLAPVDLSNVPLLQTLSSISSGILSCFSNVRFSFQRRNSRSLLRKVQVFTVLLQHHLAHEPTLDPTAVVCFKELYLLLHHSKFLLRYCAHSSKLWLLLQSPSLSSFFHDLSKDYSTLLDVLLHVDSLCLNDDVREQVELLHKQHYVDDNKDETLRNKLYSFLDEFENGSVPNSEELTFFFFEKLGIKDLISYRDEIEFLEEQIKSHGCDLEPTRSVINAFIDITRYVMFLLFKIEDDESKLSIQDVKKQRKSLIAEEIENTFTTLPQDLICSISLNVMNDPVIVSTGQTYDRTSIARWIHQEGRSTCPKTGQKLADSSFVPNLALRHLTTLWCQVNGLSHDSPPKESLPKVVFQTRASIEANKASISILVENLANGSELSAGEIRVLSRTAKETRTLILEAGAIPYLRGLLESRNAVTQENAVASIFNLSIDEGNWSLIMEKHDCLEPITSVLVSGLTMRAKEIAAVALYTLSSVHDDYKKKIANADGCIESLAFVLRNGTARGKKDAVYALHSLWLHPDNCGLVVNRGVVSALVGALADEAVAEKAAWLLGVMATESLGAESIGREEKVVTGLMELMRCGRPRGKEIAIATLLLLCTKGGAVVTEKVEKTPALAVLMSRLLLTGTDRAKRKAVSLSGILKGHD
ncbi:U box domain-containing protein [Hirschfeldia incana]|nr:U box domain-containing protein [Hirschfeldia incana]